MKSVKKFLNLIAAGVLAIFAGLLYFNFHTKHSEIHSSSLAKPAGIDMDSKVNQYMQEMQRKRTTAELNWIHRLQKGPDATTGKGIDETDPLAVSRDRQIWKDSDQQVAEQESQMDIKITKKVIKMGQFLEIPVLDHVIFSNERFFSFKDEKQI